MLQLQGALPDCRSLVHRSTPFRPYFLVRPVHGFENSPHLIVRGLVKLLMRLAGGVQLSGHPGHTTSSADSRIPCGRPLAHWCSRHEPGQVLARTTAAAARNVAVVATVLVSKPKCFTDPRPGSCQQGKEQLVPQVVAVIRSKGEID